MDILQGIGQFLASLDIDRIAWFLVLTFIFFKGRNLKMDDLIRLITAWRTTIIASPSTDDDQLLPALNAAEGILTALVQLFPQLPLPVPVPEPDVEFEFDDGDPLFGEAPR